MLRFLFLHLAVVLVVSTFNRLIELEMYFLGQTRNARKACPNGKSLPEWVLQSREIGKEKNYT